MAQRPAREPESPSRTPGPGSGTAAPSRSGAAAASRSGAATSAQSGPSAGGPSAGPRADDRAAGIPEDRADRAGGLRRRLESITGTPFTEGNEVTVLRNGDEIFPAMLDAIRGASGPWT